MRPLYVALLALPSLGVGLRDQGAHRPPSLEMPRAGETYTDPVFGTTILRVTDGDDGRRCVHAYSTWEALNRDATRLLLACDDEARLYLFDGVGVVRDGTLRGADGPKVQFEGASWSNVDPDVIYALDGQRLWRLDVSRRGAAGATVVKDFAGLFPYAFRLHQLSMSGDDRVFTFHSRDPKTGAKLDVAAYDAETDETRTFDRAGWTIDESHVDKSGRWVMVMGGGVRAGFRMWDLAEGAVASFAHEDRDAQAGGHVDLGRTLLVNSDGWETGLVVRGYDAQRGTANIRNIVRYLRPDGKLNWTIADHVSLRADAETFVVGSTYGGDGTYGAFEDEVYVAYTDGSGFVRLAHTRSAQAAGDAAERYWSQPRAVVDRAGKYVVYTSDLGSATRTDVMLLFVPQELWPEQPIAAVVPATTVEDEVPLIAEEPASGCSVGGRRHAAGWGWALVLLALGLRGRDRSHSA